MTDVELGYHLVPDSPHVGAYAAHTMKPTLRATYERLAIFTERWGDWIAGIGPRPDIKEA